MRRKIDTRPRFDHKAIGIAHNHIHGSTNCVQCGGPCTITDPTQAAYTCLIRALLDAQTFTGVGVPYMAERCLAEHGIDLKEWRKAIRPAQATSGASSPEVPK